MAALTARLSRQVLVMPDGSRHPHPAAGAGPQAVVITLPAEIDLANGGQVHDALARALRGGAAVLVADVTGATFFASAGVKELMRAHHQAAAAGAQLRVAASPAVRRILELTGANQLLDTYPTVAAALDSEQRPTGSNADGNQSHQRLPTASA